MNDKYETASLVQIRENRYSTGLHEKRGLAIMRGEGVYLWDERAVRYIDCVSGNGTANIGHANSNLISAVSEQSRRLISCSETFYNDKRAELLEKLSDLTPDFTTRFLLCNSESEATLSAFALARIATGRNQIIFCAGSSHGLTLDWGLRKTDFVSVPFNSIKQINSTVTKETAAVIIELIQCNNGVVSADVEFVNAVSQACRDHGALLIIDEVQTGFGRTGKMFALNYFGLQPDIITMAGAIAGGIPMGVVAITKAIGDKLTALPYPSAFGGNPLACAAACASIDYLREFGLPDHARELGDYFISQLKAIASPKIVNVRGQGLIVGVELTVDSGEIIQALASQGILASSAGSKVLRFLPPLVISKEDLDTVVEKTALVLA